MGLFCASRLMPGASLTTVTVSAPKPPDSSLVEPARMMMATSSEPEPSSATLKPAAIDNSATSTSVTPPIPSTATMDDDQRCGMFRRFMPVTAVICAIVLDIFDTRMDLSDSTQRVDDFEPHCRKRRTQAGHQAEHQHQRDTDDERAGTQMERREIVLDG